MNTKSEYWLCTLNYFGEEEFEYLEKTANDLLENQEIQYCTAGFEIETRAHIHLFVWYSRRVALRRIQRKFFRSRTDVDCRRLRYGQASDMTRYCQKDGVYWECGEPPRRTLAQQAEDRRQIASLMIDYVKDSLQDNPWVALTDLPRDQANWVCRNMSAFRMLRSEAQAKSCQEDKPVSVHLYWGPTGTGKSHQARAACVAHGATPVYSHNFKRFGTDWWSGYQGQSAVVFEEFDPSSCDIDHFKTLTDKYALEMEVKGSHSWKNWSHVYICSNTNPDGWWRSEDPVHREAAMRRIVEVVHMTEVYVPPDV